MTDAEKRYLLVIYELSSGGKPVRSTAVSSKLGVTKSSTAKMTSKLEEQGYIIKPRYSEITLTPEGIKTANQLSTNKLILKELFTGFMKIPEETAENDAVTCICSLSDGTVEKLIEITMKNVSRRRLKSEQKAAKTAV